MEPIELLESKLPELYKDNSCDHDINHIRRVVRNAKIIGEKEGADLSILLPAAMLHDIALKKGTLKETRDRHAILGAEIAKKILEECGFKKVDKICSTIKQHSSSNLINKSRTTEGDCLFDADKLDAINPMGVARYLQKSALEKNREPLESAEEFIGKLKSFEFRTKTGKELGKDRSKAINFCKEIIGSGKI